MEFNKEIFGKALKANKIVRYKQHFEAVVKSYLEIENQALRQPPVSGMCSGCDWIDIDYKVRKCVKCAKSEQFD